MAKSGVLETDPAILAKATELKKQLQRLVKVIVNEDDCRVETFDEAKEILSSLKDLKFKRSLSLKLETVDFPEQFRCPLSNELMRDPVILASGQTYDRNAVQRWLKAGNRTCPRTQQVLSHTILTPNLLVHDLILNWCKNHEIELPGPVNDREEAEGITNGERHQLFSLLEKMLSQSISEQRVAAKELRQLTKRMPSFRSVFGESPSSISRLLSPLLSNKVDCPPDIREDLITTILNLSIHDNNKKIVAETEGVISLLIESLKIGTIETKSNAAAALFTLSALDSNKILIGNSGAFESLIALLEEGHPLAMKDVASAIFNLCIIHENKGKAVREGAVRVILKKLIDGIFVDELLAILAMLSSHHKAIEELGELGAVSCLLKIIRESNCARNKENSVAILHTICFYDRTKWKEIREEEKVNATISQLAQKGTSRARRKASGILERMNRAVAITHTA